MRKNLLLVMALAFASEALAQKAHPKPEVPFVLLTPEGWRTETLQFPLDFAPAEKFDPKAAAVTALLTEAKSLRVHVFRCPAQGRTVALFQASPQPVTHKIWETLERIRKEFCCSKDGG